MGARVLCVKLGKQIDFIQQRATFSEAHKVEEFNLVPKIVYDDKLKSLV